MHHLFKVGGLTSGYPTITVEARNIKEAKKKYQNRRDFWNKDESPYLKYIYVERIKRVV